MPNGLLDATTDEAVIRKWLADEPAANLGVVTDRLIVLDIDPRHDGDSSLAALERDHDFPPTWRVLTGGGGEHVIFECPDGVSDRFAARRKPTRCSVPASISGRAAATSSRRRAAHISGRAYAWTVDHHPADVPIAEAPAWLMSGWRRLRASPNAHICRSRRQNWLKLTREPVTEYRDAACARFCGYLVCHLDPVVAFDILFCGTIALPAAARRRRGASHLAAHRPQPRRTHSRGGQQCVMPKTSRRSAQARSSGKKEAGTRRSQSSPSISGGISNRRRCRADCCRS